MNNNMGSKITSALETAGRGIAKMALRGAVVLGAMGTNIQNVQADTVKGVAMATGVGGGGMLAERIDLDWDPKNPAGASLSATTVFSKALDQTEAAKIGYDHMISGNNVITHQSGQAYGKNGNPGIHINYIEAIGTKVKPISDKQFDGTNIKDATTDGSGAKFGVYNDDDRLDLSEGDTPSKNQVIGTTERTKAQTGLIRTFQPVMDDKGHIVDMKLIAITDMNNDADYMQTADRRVFKDVMVATDGNGIVVVLSKNANGTWSKAAVKSMGKNALNYWTDNELRPIFPGQESKTAVKLYSFDTLVTNESLKTTTSFPNENLTTFDNGNYLFSFDQNGCAQVKNKKGEVVSLSQGLDIRTDTGFAKISENPKTFFGMGSNTFTILRVTSESPLKIEEFTMPHNVATPNIAGATNPSSYAGGHPVYFPMKDTNKDGISDFVQNAEAAPVVNPGSDAGTDTSGTPDAGGTDTSPDAGNPETDAGTTETSTGAETTEEKDAGSTDTGNSPDAGNPGTDVNSPDAGSSPDTNGTGNDASKPQGGNDNLTGPEISSQTPGVGGATPPEGCSTVPTSGDPLRNTAPLILGAALIALRRKAAEEEAKRNQQG